MDENAKRGIAIKYAWDWFSYHAAQRLTAFHFYLVIIGIVLVGYANSVEKEWLELGMALAAFGALISIAFLILDIRNTELVNCGRSALDTLETEVGVSIRKDDKERRFFYEALDPVSKKVLRGFGFHENTRLVGTTRGNLTRHQFWLRLIQYITIASFVVLAIATKPIVGEQAGRRQRLDIKTTGERLSLRLEGIEDRVSDLALLRAAAAQGDMADSYVRSQIGTLLIVAREAVRECGRVRVAEKECETFEKWNRNSIGLLEKVLGEKSPSQGLRAIAGDRWRELESGLVEAKKAFVKLGGR